MGLSGLTIEITPPEPWEHQPGEPQKAWDAFQVYRDLGPARTLEAAYRKMWPSKGRATGCWKNWKVVYRWQERAEAFDMWVNQQTRLAAEEEIRRSGKHWVERALQHREDIWKRAGKLLEKIESALENPIKGKELTPVDLMMLSNAMQTTDKARRLAAGMETDRKAVDATMPEGEPGAQPSQDEPGVVLMDDAVDPSHLEDEELYDRALAELTQQALTRARSTTEEDRGAARGGAAEADSGGPAGGGERPAESPAR